MTPVLRGCQKSWHGLHDWYADNLIFTEVNRCRHCRIADNPVLDEIREIEERAWHELRRLDTRERILELKKRVNAARTIRGLKPLSEQDVA